MNLDTALQNAINEGGVIAERLGWLSLPIQVERMAHILGVAEVTPTIMASDGYIGRRNDGRFVIRYNDASPRQRKRFTIAHEIGHLLLSKHLNENLVRRNRSGPPDSVEELYANRIASEILMPTNLFMNYFFEMIYRGMRSPWKVISNLKTRFDVAESSAVLRVLELNQVVAVLFRINVVGTGSDFPFDGSQEVPFKVVEMPKVAARRLWNEYQAGERFHSVPVLTAGKTFDLKCEGRLRTFKTDRGQVSQYWVLGWQPIR